MAKAARQFQVFAKPVGPACNMDCSYCYYVGKLDLLPDAASPRMSPEVLEAYIAGHIEASPETTITFSWHGGEPTLAGLDYFRKIVELESRHRPFGKRIDNGLQTNGLLLDAEWCRFFAAEGFRVGLSLDGPAELHDPFRLARGGQPTHKQVLRAYDLLRRHKVFCDLLCVVHPLNVRRPLDVYRFFRDIGAQSLTFLPLVERVPGGAGPRSVPAEAFGAFLIKIHGEWARRDQARIGVQFFEEASRPARGIEHSLCVLRPTCGEIPVVERNGDFYCCDHYVDPRHRLGNITQTPLADLLESPAQRAFGDAKRDSLPAFCRACDVLDMCNGGCPKDRFLSAPDGEPGLNYLCAGYRAFFRYFRGHAPARA